VEDTGFFVFEEIKGPSLHQLIEAVKNKSISMTEHHIHAIVQNVLSAVQYLHEQKHLCGLNTHQIFIHFTHVTIQSYPTVSLITESNVNFIPTPIQKYIDPETVTGEASSALISDIYSLGILLYELFSLSLPDKNVLTFSEFPIQIPSEFTNLIKRSSTYFRNNRIPTITDFATEYQAILSEKQIAVNPESLISLRLDLILPPTHHQSSFNLEPKAKPPIMSDFSTLLNKYKSAKHEAYDPQLQDVSVNSVFSFSTDDDENASPQKVTADTDFVEDKTSRITEDELKANLKIIKKAMVNQGSLITPKLFFSTIITILVAIVALTVLVYEQLHMKEKLTQEQIDQIIYNSVNKNEQITQNLQINSLKAIEDYKEKLNSQKTPEPKRP